MLLWLGFISIAAGGLSRWAFTGHENNQENNPKPRPAAHLQIPRMPPVMKSPAPPTSAKPRISVKTLLSKLRNLHLTMTVLHPPTITMTIPEPDLAQTVPRESTCTWTW